MKQEVRFLLEIIKYILNEKAVAQPLPTDAMNWQSLFQVANRHSLANLVYYGIKDLPEELKPNQEMYENIYLQAMQEAAKSCNQIEAAKEVLEAFEKNGLSVLAVKGICTKQHYPQTDMRTMGDIDILYRVSEQEKVKKVMRQLGYRMSMEGRKHDHYIREPFVSFEMHRELVASDSVYSSYYKNIWNKLRVKKGCRFIYEMSREDEYLYTIVHLAEHFKKGGIGIRFVMDIYVFDCMKDMNWNYIETELKKLELWEFYQNISWLAKSWFAAYEMDIPQEKKGILEKLSTYVVLNATYGTQENEAALSVAKDGRLQYLLRTVFPDLKNMQSMFPWLEKWPILLPYSWVLRGVRSVIYRRKNIKIHLNQYRYGNKEYGEELKSFFKTCGL